MLQFFSLTGSENEPYEILYSGKVQRGLDNALFDTEMVSKKNSRAKFKYGIDRGLAVAAKRRQGGFSSKLIDRRFRIQYQKCST